MDNKVCDAETTRAAFAELPINRVSGISQGAIRAGFSGGYNSTSDSGAVNYIALVVELERGGYPSSISGHRRYYHNQDNN